MNKIINTTDTPLDEIMDDSGKALKDYINADENSWDVPYFTENETLDINKDSTPFTLPGQIPAPGETELLNMNGVVFMEKEYPSFKIWLEHQFTHKKVEIDEFDDEAGCYKWYPEPLDPNGIDGKFDFMYCHIINWKECETIKKFMAYFNGRLYPRFDFPEVNLYNLAFFVNQQPCGMWSTRFVNEENLKKFYPMFQPADRDDNSYHDLFHNTMRALTIAIRPFELDAYKKFAGTLATKYRAFAIDQFGTEKRLDKEFKQVMKILNNLPTAPVIIPYKGKEFYGEERNGRGYF